MSDLKKELIKLIKKYKPDRKEFENILREVRRDETIKSILGPRKRKSVKLPRIPTLEEIKKLLEVIEKDKNMKFKLMVKLLLYTGIRVNELTNIKKYDVNLNEQTIFIENGKGNKDRYVPILNQFKDVLAFYLSTIPNNKYLFENKFHDKYSTRYIRKIFQNYCKQAGIFRIHPHLLRHVFITFLSNNGWTDEEIMLISGHSSKEALHIYQHLKFKDIFNKYQKTMKDLDI